MNQFKVFLELARLNKPIGFMLLFWPCSWGLALAFNSNHNTDEFIYFLILFFLGSVLMRSAGCIVNDIVDRDLDKKVRRTKNRPIASNIISVKQALVFVCVLCILAFLILIQFNKLTILLGFASMFFAFTYPYMKRVTYWPQLFLGLTFNWGIIMAWVAVNNNFSSDIFILYLAAIFWTLGYDTIYGAQDIADDEIIGVKSTSIKFKNRMKFFVSICYILSSSFIIYLFYSYIGFNYFTMLLSIFILTLIFQIFFFKKDVPETCLKAFKLNNFSGLILFLGIVLIN